MFNNIPPDDPPEKTTPPRKAWNQDDALEEAYAVAADLFDEGVAASAIRKELIQAGFSPQMVTQVMSDFVAENRPRQRKRRSRQSSESLGRGGKSVEREQIHFQQSQALREAGQRNMLIGGVICLIGLAVTAVSFMAAQGGGGFILAWGAILFGGIQFFRGVAQAGS